ncbi:MAG: hypothetical protein QF570_01800 [Myxococcota bacterium]|jgi:alkanesulfonate monooxygenase SsuD/methylene tetrahydromethanopterin reductase-like flavin-dependent oxidoreductase (luciferase family)|nr:hypothetical protein [Myxococcota bacterium]
MAIRMGVGFVADQPGEVRERLAKVTVVGDAEAVLDRVRTDHDLGIDKFIAILLANDEAEVMEQTWLLDREVISALPSITL